MAEQSEYERRASREIDLFKNPPSSLLRSAWNLATAPVGWVAGLALNNPIGEAAIRAFVGPVSLINDAASWSVRTEAILAEFRAGGHPNVARLADVRQLDLGEVDRTVGYLAAKYKALAAAEGLATGALGLPGLAADVPALVVLALRAIHEYATYYGFDVGLEQERAFALSILVAATSPKVASKQVALVEVTRLSVMLAQRKTWDELHRLVSVQLIRKVAEALGVRLTKAKLAQVIPVIGAGVGAGFNAWYLANVTETAFHLYRERFLIEKQGAPIAEPVRSA